MYASIQQQFEKTGYQEIDSTLIFAALPRGSIKMSVAVAGKTISTPAATF